MASRRQKITVTVEDVVKKEPLYTVGENVKWSNTMESNKEIP